MGIRFIIDSASDLLPQDAAELGVTLAPLQVTFAEETYRDGVDLSHEDFFKKLTESDVFPVTSQCNPAAYETLYEALTADGSQVVVVALSSKLSGTYQSARIAAENFAGKVFVVDSLNATVGQRILMEYGLSLAKQGLDGKQIAEALEKERSNLRLVAVVDTLEYLKKGGRIPPAVAFAGGVLGIKPLIAVENGEVVIAGKARGAKQAAALLMQLAENAGPIDWEKPVAAVYGGIDTGLQQFIHGAQSLWQGRDVPPIYTLGATIGAHVGPGAYGIAFFVK